MFPGQGAQYAGMGAELSRAEPVFREAFDQCASIFKAQTGKDLEPAIRDAARLTQTEIAQPALFAIEYALAQLVQSWGIQPAAMIGHSVGEYVAAVLAEVMTLEDAVRLVAGRAQIVQKLPPGGMLAARLSEAEAAAMANGRLSLAAANGPKLTVLSGPAEDLARVERTLEQSGIAARRLCTSHAFHSNMMEPAVAPFTALVRSVRLQAPKMPFVSNVTGRWITAAEATDPQYWAAHLRQTVRFSAGIIELLKEPGRTFLELGPGNGLSQLARQHGPVQAIPTLEADGEHRSALTALGRLWLAGAPVQWTALHPGDAPRRVSLPGYPFERQRYWIEPQRARKDAGSPNARREINGGAISGSAVGAEELILQQLQLMAHQLETLRAGASQP
jgi:acyl transferase domain-containing protein